MVERFSGRISSEVLGITIYSHRALELLLRGFNAAYNTRRQLFMLDWFDDPEQRRRTGSILNKGEARNALARAIFFNCLGEQRDRTFKNQRHRASGLTLLTALTAAVTLWNTVYLDCAVRHLRGSGVEVPDELLTHVAPLSWEHVGLTGDYMCSEMDKPRERFRPRRLHRTGREA